jgi:ABC-type antimicrobial peptide transport system permease subunit
LATRQAKREFYLWTLSLFGGLAGVLAAVGIYGVMAHVVGLRAREVGIRLALGARPSQIKLLVVGQGLRPVMIGLAGGLVVAWWTTDLLRVNTVFASQLFHVTPHDPWTFAAACAGLLGVAVIACWIPARRTSRLDPAAVLKAE